MGNRENDVYRFLRALARKLTIGVDQGFNIHGSYKQNASGSLSPWVTLTLEGGDTYAFDPQNDAEHRWHYYDGSDVLDGQFVHTEDPNRYVLLLKTGEGHGQIEAAKRSDGQDVTVYVTLAENPQETYRYDRIDKVINRFDKDTLVAAK